MKRRGPESWDDYFVCPHCGAEVRAGARSCPECGSDDQTGWAEDANAAGVDLPTGYGGDDEFDYDEFVQREFGGPSRLSPRRLMALAMAIVLAVVVLFMLLKSFAS